ncbi:DegT/DnrJ/EryC1/StrS family aminotransferase [Aquibaculum arenosum]|uniref:Aminotransferase class I/II-fold pyridoxal phosphate-dependent enzyme n=1 Tax=Aquibaculum arenosum TaxID=3032591 RepID=A0ABT5YLL6_9PROT|nr:aminotransferase class I/II-fold pyridoxal phosphate-dependent enzyme [Fodinicurvata sp. CAU 1616]MDF2095824.1 aminotransferase class I/II-fold pyridoxal phosphate-dependent enzyme [Fodinicurvata sp. CAU 1616]
MTQFEVFLSPPHLAGNEGALIEAALTSNYVAPAGPMLDRFEREFSDYVGMPCVAVSSGTAALHLALRHLEVGPGDEVWAASLTFIGSVAPVIYQGARPVFLDSDPASWTLDPGLLEEALRDAARRGQLPKAVIPTDIYGQSCDLDAIRRLCDAYEVPVLCDSAEAVGSRYKGRAAGKGAWAAAYSFNGNKIITTSGGGALASEDPALIAAARKLATQAREPVPHYEHRSVGYNYRLSNISAAIGCAQLAVIEARVALRRAIFERYRAALGDLPGVTFMPELDHGGSRASRWLTVLLIDPERAGCDRETVRLALEAAGIEARPVWKPMHLQPVFAGARCHGGAVAERLFANGLCLPSGSAMSDETVERVAAEARYCLLREEQAGQSVTRRAG